VTNGCSFERQDEILVVVNIAQWTSAIDADRTWDWLAANGESSDYSEHFPGGGHENSPCPGNFRLEINL